MSYIVVDVKSDGPISAEFSVVCFGAVTFDNHPEKTFYGQTHPVPDRFAPDALAVSEFPCEQHLGFDEPTRLQLFCFMAQSSIIHGTVMPLLPAHQII